MRLDLRNVPPALGYYLAGFTDGEGSFNVCFRRRRSSRTAWKVSLCFNVSQKDEAILRLFQRTLDCGTVRGRRDGVWYFEVNGFDSICRNVIPFFTRFPFLSAKKQRDFASFVRLASLIGEGRHLQADGLREIVKIRSGMNDGGAGRRKYSDEEILLEPAGGESPEAICQARQELGMPPLLKRDEMVRSP